MGFQANLSPRAVAEVYTLSYLVLFAILGTLARLGLQVLTTYPGLPVTFTSAWPNFGGSFIIGFLAKDRVLFRASRTVPPGPAVQPTSTPPTGPDPDSGPGQPEPEPPAVPPKQADPLDIGLATGFCGSLTSFSSFIRDAFLALSNDLETADHGGDQAIMRDAGQSFMAFTAVLLVTLSLSFGGLCAGAHLAVSLQPMLPSLGRGILRSLIDRSVVAVSWAAWLTAILLCIMSPSDTLRGQVLFALAFAPLGCLARFYLSLALNGRFLPVFPLGTFTANLTGTGILAMSWNISHLQIGGVLGCQILRGIEDGFCGCLTTVSTWVVEVAELSRLRRRDAYSYAIVSVITAVAIVVSIMGSLTWAHGVQMQLECGH